MGTETKAFPAAELKKDEFAYNALLAIGGYQPAQAQYSIDVITSSYDALKLAQRIEVQKQGELKAARDNAVAAAHAFHAAMLQAKTQVRAQFGEDSNELQSLGLKKKSERKTPSRKPAVKKLSNDH
ncbi:MAG: hypothetical protein LBU92_06275 [Prevotellaceae bacterium]|nr:hypothetical protein [Prevotellaceae bacterium]